jgi:hypothetical protein
MTSYNFGYFYFQLELSWTYINVVVFKKILYSYNTLRKSIRQKIGKFHDLADIIILFGKFQGATYIICQSFGIGIGMELYKRAIYSIPVSTENYNVYSIGKLAIMQEGELDNIR